MIGEVAVQAAKLMAAENEILQAVAEFRTAAKDAKLAGDNLAADWTGDAREAFVAEQAKAYDWQLKISDIVDAFAFSIRKTVEKYQQAEEQIRNLIGNN